MGVKDFFRKIGNGIRRAGRFVRDKVFPAVGRLAKPVFGMISGLPGIIGNVGRIGSAVTGALTGAVSQIPNEQARDRIQNVINNTNDKFQNVVDRGRNMAETTNNVIDKFKNDPNMQRFIDNMKKKFPVDQASIVKPK